MDQPCRTIVIVDDSPEDRELYRRYLLSDLDYTYTILEAGLGRQGLDLWQHHRPDALLLDYRLPDLDGLDFLSQLKSFTPQPCLPIIMVTGSGNEAIAVQAMKSGAQDYLIKEHITPAGLQLAINGVISTVQVHTQLQQREAQLQQSEEFKNRMLESSQDCIKVLDRDGQILYVNEGGRCLLEIDDIAPYINSEWLSFWNDEHRQQAEQALAAATSGDTSLFRGYSPTVKGTPKWWEVILSPMMDASSQVPQVLAVSRDITERKLAETALQKSEERYRTLFESMEDGFCIIELLFDETNTPIDYRFLEINPAFEQQTGLKQAVGKTARQLIPDLEEHWFEVYGKVALTGEPVRFENGSDAMKRWFDVYAFRIESPESRKVAILFKDISDRKLAEQETRESEAQLRTGVQVAGIGLAKFDYATSLVSLSPEAAILYGFSTEELVVSREQIHATFHPAERAELEEMIAQALDPQGTGLFDTDHRVVWPNGEVRGLSVRKQVFFDTSGVIPRPSYAILAAIDVTDRNQTQAELEKRNQELDSFVQIVSHDLKAPLRGISNLSQWIEEDLGELLPADIQSQMTLLRSRVNRMEIMINGLLDYARVGRTDDMVERVVVEELLAEVIDSLAPPVTFNITLAPNLPTLYAKRLLLSQVFTNLIGNGIKHHNQPDGSIHISGQDQGDFYEFVVTDNGPGIAPEYHDKIFMIFQVGNHKPSQDSSGIGLSIVKKIVEAEEGSIRLESQLKKGTTFYFTWPKQP
jgi:PAS domain S-box-containing protein